LFQSLRFSVTVANLPAKGTRFAATVVPSFFSRFLARTPSVNGIACMKPQNLIQRLSLIQTQWSLVCLAHHGLAEAASAARQQLLERYRNAVYRYLRKVLRNPDAADEVFQEFALRLVRGDLRGANPQRGRFRDFVKGTLFHLVADHRKKQRQWPGPLPADGSTLAANPDDGEADHLFEEDWCDELLARAWAALAEIEARTDQPYYAVLRFRADHPEMRSPQLAEQLTARLGRPFTAVGVRQALHRAREKFADLLLDELAHSLENPRAEQLAQELVELGLLDYCRPALERRSLKV
jgi:RNA polymerase sigma-70 factor (ECF subfamily)